MFRSLQRAWYQWKMHTAVCQNRCMSRNGTISPTVYATCQTEFRHQRDMGYREEAEEETSMVANYWHVWLLPVSTCSDREIVNITDTGYRHKVLFINQNKRTCKPTLSKTCVYCLKMEKTTYGWNLLNLLEELSKLTEFSSEGLSKFLSKLVRIYVKFGPWKYRPIFTR